MIEYEVMGHLIREGTESEIRAAWAGTAVDERRCFWTHSEITAHLLATPAELDVLFQRKAAKPGRL